MDAIMRPYRSRIMIEPDANMRPNRAMLRRDAYLRPPTSIPPTNAILWKLGNVYRSGLKVASQGIEVL
jgi:hypothetical protein